MSKSDVADDLLTLNRDGIVGFKGAFSRAWAEQMREDMMTAFWEAIQRPGGAVGRGPRRWYVEVHPEAISGFVDLERTSSHAYPFARGRRGADARRRRRPPRFPSLAPDLRRRRY